MQEQTNVIEISRNSFAANDNIIVSDTESSRKIHVIVYWNPGFGEYNIVEAHIDHSNAVRAMNRLCKAREPNSYIEYFLFETDLK